MGIRLRVGIALGAAALLAGILVPAGPARAVPATTAPAPVVTGTVRFHGKPVAGATVKLYADPLPSVLRKVKVADRVPDVLIGKTTTNKRGYYSIRVSAKGLAILRARAVRGIANLHVLAFTHKDGTVFWFPRKIALAKLGNTAGSVGSLATPEVANLTLAGNGNTSISPLVRRLFKIGPKAGFNFGVCGQRILVFNLGPKWTVVGGTYSNMSDVDMLFTYTAGQGSTLGVGFSPSFLGSNEPGPGSLGMQFTQNSTISWNSSITEPYTPHSGIENDIYETQFIYGAYFTICAGWDVQPIGFAGGTTHQQVLSTPTDNPYCVTYEAAPNPVVISNGRANVYGGGVNILGVIGFNLSAETDHDTSSQLEYTFPHGGPLCGLNGYVGSSDPGLIYAGYWEHSPKARKK